MPASAYAGVCLNGSYPPAGCRFFAGSSSYLLFFVELFLVLLLIVVDFLSSVERVHSTLGGCRAGFLCSLVLFLGPPFASSSASVFCWRGFFLDSPTLVALLAGSLRSASPVLFSVSGLSALVPVVQVCLRAARVSAGWTVPFLLALSGAPGFQSFFSFSSAQISLSLSLGLSCSSLSPLGFYWLGLVSVLATFVAWIVPRHLMVAYLLVSLRFFPVLFRSLFPTFLVGSGSFASLDVLPVRSSGLSGAFVALPGSLLFILPGFGSLSCQFPVVGLVLCFLPCGPAPGLSLFGLLAVPPFLLSRFVAVCFPGLWVSLFPGSFLVLGSSFPVLVIYSFLLRGTRCGIWVLPSAPLGCFILLSLTSGLLFLFLATAFPTVQLVPRFSLLLF